MQNSGIRIGITMREVQAEGYSELRDALARDWPRFLSAALPEASWLPIPNIGAKAACEFAERWQLTGLILSGGEDLGSSALRDETENALFRHFYDAGMPVMGVCRGMQLIWTNLGGKLARSELHRTVRHFVNFSVDTEIDVETQTREVNSYHVNCLEQDTDCPASVTILACAQDGTIEAFRLAGFPVLALMWHPEREVKPHPTDIHLMRKIFGANPA
jgi:N5-(cytidine 5'-diphosphoramidyl)-L-glutamine hydrolase